jgi:hypothetical protein
LLSACVAAHVEVSLDIRTVLLIDFSLAAVATGGLGVCGLFVKHFGP